MSDVDEIVKAYDEALAELNRLQETYLKLIAQFRTLLLQRRREALRKAQTSHV
jgi:hypothetical protein